MDNPVPARGASVELVEITAANYREAFGLKVHPGQERFVASNAVSIAQAHFHPEAWFRLVRAGGVPVGFAMLSALSHETLTTQELGKPLSSLGLAVGDVVHALTRDGDHAFELVKP